MPTRLQWETFSQWAKDYGRLFREGNDMGSGDISKRELWTSAILGHHLILLWLLIALSPGDMVYLKVFGTSIVVINSHAIAFDLFEKRSSIYSDRCEFPMINDLYVHDVSLWIRSYLPVIMYHVVQNGLGMGLGFHALWRAVAAQSQTHSSKIPPNGCSRIPFYPD